MCQKPTSIPITNEIIKIVSKHGPITPAEYMRSALNHPLHGYYRNESSGAATITNDKDPFDKSYDLLANDLNKTGPNMPMMELTEFFVRSTYCLKC